jgi:hypothetical protein
MKQERNICTEPANFVCELDEVAKIFGFLLVEREQKPIPLLQIPIGRVHFPMRWIHVELHNMQAVYLAYHVLHYVCSLRQLEDGEPDGYRTCQN